MLKAFPGSPVYTSLYEPNGTFPEFRDADVRTSRLNAVLPFRHDPRRALALLAPTFSNMRVAADVTFCSSSGWAHGCRVTGQKVVYCHNPARWLYQSTDYFGDELRLAARLALAALRPRLVRWDRAAAASADLYLTQSRAVQSRIAAAYGLTAALVQAPAGVSAALPGAKVDGVAPGFLLCVCRLQTYKNVRAVLEAFRTLDAQLVVVGDGPERARLKEQAPSNARLVGTVPDEQLRWLYANCSGVVAASYEDYGLTPLEGLCFGRPTAALRYGGFLDTVREGETGVFFDRPEPDEIAVAVKAVLSTRWEPEVLEKASLPYREETFIARLREIASESCCPEKAAGR